MTPNKTGGLLATLAIFCLSASAQSNADSDNLPEKYHSLQEISRVYDNDSSGNLIEQISTYLDGSHYKVRKVNGKITELYLDGRKIAADSLAAFEPAIVALDEHIKRDKEQSRKYMARAWKERKEAEMDRQQYQHDLRREERDHQMEETYLEQAEKYKRLAEQYAWKAQMGYKQVGNGRDLDAEAGARQMRADREMMRNLIRDLVKEKIISDEKDLSWMALTDDKLIVNGKKQPKSVHEKFVSKYITKPGFGIFYGDPQVPGKGLFLNKQDLNQVDL